MPRMWADKTVDELREEWLQLQDRREQFVERGMIGGHAEIDDAIEAIELEIGRRRKPLVVSETP